MIIPHTGQEVKILNQGVLVWEIARGRPRRGGETEGKREGEQGREAVDYNEREYKIAL